MKTATAIERASDSTAILFSATPHGQALIEFLNSPATYRNHLTADP